MTKFRACIDLHQGKVKQIVGGTLDSHQLELQTNFTSEHNARYYAKLYRERQLFGSHMIKLGPNNDEEAISALQEWNDIQVGGGITLENASIWIEHGASKVIVTSCLFKDSKFQLQNLKQLESQIGKDRIVIDLSCRKQIVNNQPQWIVAMNKWQTLTDLILSQSVFDELKNYCAEFLVHAADVEGLCQGIDQELVVKLGEWCTIPCTYAGGANSISDLDLVKRLSNGKVDLTMGSCLDIFGGKISFDEAVQWNKTQ